MSPKKTSHSTPKKTLLSPKHPKHHLHDRLKYARLLAGLKPNDIQKIVVEAMGVKQSKGFSASQVTRWEQDQCNLTDTYKISILANVYKVSFMWLAHHHGLMTPDDPRSDDIRIIDAYIKRSPPGLVAIFKNLIEGVVTEFENMERKD